MAIDSLFLPKNVRTLGKNVRYPRYQDTAFSQLWYKVYLYTGPPKSSLVGVVLNFTKFTKDFTKTFTFYTFIIQLPGKQNI